jgi:DNA-binding response OmpR family regulator
MEEIRILIAEKDGHTRRTLREHAAQTGWSVDEAADGVSALKLFRRKDYQAILLNMDLPELDGRNVLIQIRKASDVPILVLCDKPAEDNCLICFQLGADDYIRKPFNPLEVIARIHVFLHRNSIEKEIPKKGISYKGLRIDAFSRSAYVDDRLISLTPKEYALLVFLAQNPNVAFPRSAILDEVWGSDFCCSDRTVDTHVKSLRNAVHPYEAFITTVWGFGYKFTV